MIIIMIIMILSVLVFRTPHYLRTSLFLGRCAIVFQALVSVPTLLDESVFMAAVDSKEPEMAKEVLECVRNSLSDDQVSHITRQTAGSRTQAILSPGGLFDERFHRQCRKW